MRIPRSQATAMDPTDLYFPVLPDQVAERNASIGIKSHLFNQYLLTNNLSESRTSGTSKLRATASARRLCGN